MPSGTAWLIAGGGLAVLGAALVLGRPRCASGQLAIELQAQGPGQVCAGTICTRSRQTVCPESGQLVQYSAAADQGHSFEQFQGPGGVSTTQNPFQAPTASAGFVRGVFQ